MAYEARKHCPVAVSGSVSATGRHRQVVVFEMGKELIKGIVNNQEKEGVDTNKAATGPSAKTRRQGRRKLVAQQPPEGDVRGVQKYGAAVAQSEGVGEVEERRAAGGCKNM